MSEFLLFVSRTYYPFGGLNDCKGRFVSKDALDDAVRRIPIGTDSYSLRDIHALQVPEMLVHIYDDKGRYEGVVTLDRFLSAEDEE